MCLMQMKQISKWYKEINMEKFNLEKELVDVVKKINRDVVRNAHTESLVLVAKSLCEEDKTYLTDVDNIIGMMAQIAKELDTDMAADVLSDFIQSIKDTLIERGALKEKEGSSDDKEDEVDAKAEEEKIKDYFKRLGFDAEVEVVVKND